MGIESELVYIYISMSVTLSTLVDSTCSRWHSDQLHGCRLCISDARRVRDRDKLITSFYPGRFSRFAGRIDDGAVFLVLMWLLDALNCWLASLLKENL